MTSGYLSSTSFYIFLIITIILIFILCISNIVAYGNILANENIEFNRTWAKILIAMNAILIAIAFVIMIILIIKFYKGRRTTVPMATAGVSAAGAAGGTATVNQLYKLVRNKGVDWDQTITEEGGNCNSMFDRGCSFDVGCSDGGSTLPCSVNTANDRAINKLFLEARNAGISI